MAMSTAATVTSLDGFHATLAAQRADELVRALRALFDAVNAGDPARTDAVMTIPGTCHRGHGLRVFWIRLPGRGGHNACY